MERLLGKQSPEKGIPKVAKSQAGIFLLVTQLPVYIVLQNKMFLGQGSAPLN